MYGLEWALLLPTIAPLQVFCGNDFFPRDVATALADFEGSTILVSTPVHLKALLKTRTPPGIDVAVCATAPLAQDLAQTVEQHLHTELFEVYGCSEVGSLASKATAREPHWTFFDSFDRELSGQTLTIRSPLLPAPVELGDAFAAAPDGRFELLGRANDIVKIAGKRESLSHLNHIALSIAGVEDAAFFQPSQLGLDDSGRLGLLLVAPELSQATLKRELAQRLDSAFMPRPIYQVAALPREPSSKLPQAALAALVNQLRAPGSDR